MPWVQPLPLGGLASELGNITERLRAIEVTRSGWEIVSTAIVTETSSTFPAWDTPSGWPVIDVVCTNPLGVTIIFGGLIDIPSGGAVNRVYLGVAIDGVPYIPPRGVAGGTFGTDSFPVPTANLNAVEIAPMTVGGHVLSLQLSSNGPGPYSCYNQFLIVGPIP